MDLTGQFALDLRPKISKMDSIPNDTPPGDLLPKEDTVLTSAASMTQVVHRSIFL